MSLGPSLGHWITSHLPGSRFLLASLATASTATALSSHLVYTAGLVTLGGALLHLHRTQQQSAALHRQELALRKELLAYLLFNGSPRTMAAADLGRQISRLVAVRSSFPRAALLLRDAAGILSVTGSAGLDDLSVEALNRWGLTVSDPELPMAHIAAGHPRVATTSFTLPLDRRCTERSPLSSMSCRDVHIVPLRTTQGLVGALAVCSRPRSASKPADDLELSWLLGKSTSLPLADLLQPLEAFALRLTVQLATTDTLTGVSPARRPIRPSRPDRAADRNARLARNRNLASRVTGSPVCTPQNEAPSASALPPPTASFGSMRQMLEPAFLPSERITGVSGRPPARTWRSSAGPAA